MQSITLRQLRDTKQVKTWLRAGVHIEVRERNEVIGIWCRERRRGQRWSGPILKRAQSEIFGDRVLNLVDVLIEERNSRY